MGNADSTYISTMIDMAKNPQSNPVFGEKSTKDPMFGFTSREERVAKVSEEDMYWAKIPPNRRDYCGHHLIELQRCRKINFPFLYKCSHIKHDWDHCQNEDFVYRMKEFERERRLLKREERKKAKSFDEQVIN